MPKMILGFMMLILSMNAKAQEVCAGGWQYEQLGFCANAAAGCSVSEVDVYNSCEAKVSNNELGCGVESYESCAHMSCEGSVKASEYSVTNSGCNAGDTKLSSGQTNIPYPPYSIAWTRCQKPDKPASCVNSSCSVKKWKSCRDISCGVEKKSCPGEAYNKSYSTVCGQPTLMVSALNSVRPANDGKTPKDFYGLGSICITCDDIPLDTPANVRKRFDCLAKGMDLADQQKTGYSYKVGTKIFQQLEDIGNNFSSSLTSEQIARLTAILSGN